LLDFGGDFASTPLADRALGVLRRLASQRDNLANLLGADLDRLTRSGGIGQALGDRQVIQAGRLQGEPARTPAANGIEANIELARKLAVIGAISRRKHNPRTERDLLRSRMATGKVFEFVTFDI
jgi:hypothetical protein